jgi:hypothetical protein
MGPRSRLRSIGPGARALASSLRTLPPGGAGLFLVADLAVLRSAIANEDAVDDMALVLHVHQAVFKTWRCRDPAFKSEISGFILMPSGTRRVSFALSIGATHHAILRAFIRCLDCHTGPTRISRCQLPSLDDWTVPRPLPS